MKKKSPMHDLYQSSEGNFYRGQFMPFWRRVWLFLNPIARKRHEAEQLAIIRELVSGKARR